MQADVVVFDRVVGVPAEGLAIDALLARLEEIRGLRRALDVAEAAAVAEIAVRHPVHGRAAVDQEFRRLDDRAGVRRADAAVALADMPAVRAAFEGRLLSLRQVQVLDAARVLCPERFAVDEGELVAKAEGRSVRSFTRAVRQWKMTHCPDAFAKTQPEPGLVLGEAEHGFHTLGGVLDTVAANIVAKALRDVLDEEWRAEHPQRRDRKEPLEPYPARLARALVTVCERSLSGHTSRPGVPRYSLGVLIDHQTMVNGLHAKSVCITDNGEPLPVEVVRKLACDADIYPIVLNGDGIPIDLGRSQRLFNYQQRKALLAMDSECMLDGCLPARDCHAHHNHDWDHGGPTDIDNGCMLAGRCHDTVHQLGLTIRREGGYVTFYRPDGSVYARTKHN